MKTAISIVWFSATVAVLGQQTVAFEAIRVTNVATQSRTAMRRLYQSDRTSRRTPDDATMAALRWFGTTQNQDGSWGEPGVRSLATPLVLLAYLGRGETIFSKEFGETIVRGHNWLMANSPTDDDARLATVISLVEYAALQETGAQGHLSSNVAAKVTSLLGAVATNNASSWAEMLTFHRLPSNIGRPAWLNYSAHADPKWLAVHPSLTPTNTESYLALRMAVLGKSRGPTQQWHEFYREYAVSLLTRQCKDGSFPCNKTSEVFTCTALAIHSLEAYGIMLPAVWIPVKLEPPRTRDAESAPPEQTR